MNSSRTGKHYVILRDDDTNALTPVDQLERLYRPFLQRGMPVNLATIPNVRTDAVDTRGRREGFLPVPDQSAIAISDKPDALVFPQRTAIRRLHSYALHANGNHSGKSEHLPLSSRNGNAWNDSQPPRAIPIGENNDLVCYLTANQGYHIIQHGFHHSCCEFGSRNAVEIGRWLDQGTQILMEAGFPRPETFVAPHDRFSRPSIHETARRFRVISTGWFELRRIPISWWPGYGLKKLLGSPHWRVGSTRLLSHPGCLLSYHKPYESMLESIRQSVASRQLTVLVTHWWEYFHDGAADEAFIDVLHDLAAWLAGRSDVQVISFEEVAQGKLPLS